MGSELGFHKYRLNNKSLLVDLYYGQDQLNLCRLSLGSELRLNKLRFRTKSLGVDFY